jgi:protein SCO1/2
MDHSAASYIYDTKGNLRLYSRYGSGAEALLSDIRILLKQA